MFTLKRLEAGWFENSLVARKEDESAKEVERIVAGISLVDAPLPNVPFLLKYAVGWLLGGRQVIGVDRN